MQTSPNPMAALIQAVAFAAVKLRNQRHKDAEASPYINHPIALANVLANEGGVHPGMEAVFDGLYARRLGLAG